MKIISALKTGLKRSLGAWKVILVLWIVSLTMVSLVVVPLKASLNAAFGSSMVTEKLMKGINFDVLGDLGKNMHSFGSSLFAGLILLSLLAILVNIFITGGLFEVLKQGTEKITTESFFSSSAKNFWPFLLITVILYLIVAFLIVIVVVIPVAIAGHSESAPEGVEFLTFVVACAVFIVVISMINIIADYSRARQVSKIHRISLRALGFGFSQTFRTFFSSFSLGIIMICLQALVGWAMIKIIIIYTPETSGGVFLLFLTSQLLFLIKVFFKVMRYGSVTSLMELNPVSGPPVQDNILKSDPENFTDYITEIKQETNV